MRFRSGIAGLAGLDADVCVVGAGPVGLATAARLAERGLTTVLIESGERRPGRPSDLSEVEELSEATHADVQMTVCRALGGASWLWGGRCVPMSDQDLQGRSWLRDSRWPIDLADVAPFFPFTSRFFDAGSPIFSDPLEPELATADPGPRVRCDTLERWCNNPLLAPQFVAKSRSEKLIVVLGATVVDIAFSAEGDRVASLRVADRSGAISYDRPRAFVLACGGLETARLLLNVQAERPMAFGGHGGPLGRYYMGHLSGRVSDIMFQRPADARAFDYRTRGGSVTRRRLTLAETQAARLPNVSFLPSNPSLADSAHRIGALSAVFLLLSTPVIGPRLLSEPIRRMQLAGGRDYLAHLRNVLLDAPRTAHLLGNLLHQAIKEGRRKPLFFIPSEHGIYPLHYHAEHLPNPDSRVTLAGAKDALGLRRLRIDLRFGRDDAEGVAAAHLALKRGLESSGLARLRLQLSGEDLPGSVLAQARDGFHQIGLTRMGVNARDGVVDRDCKVFGLQNLFLAGSGVFRTSGEANPTYFAAALGVRLADHLARLLGNST